MTIPLSALEMKDASLYKFRMRYDITVVASAGNFYTPDSFTFSEAFDDNPVITGIYIRIQTYLHFVKPRSCQNI